MERALCNQTRFCWHCCFLRGLMKFSRSGLARLFHEGTHGASVMVPVRLGRRCCFRRGSREACVVRFIPTLVALLLHEGSHGVVYLT